MGSIKLLTSCCVILVCVYAAVVSSSICKGQGKSCQQQSEVAIDVDVDNTFNSGVLDGCRSNPCIHGGLCKGNGSHYECFCPAGFTGSKCEKYLIDVCDPNPCLNGGLCFEMDTMHPNYVCFCASGYAGLKCERAIDVCDPNPCLNNGVCSKGNYSIYTCYCPPGYTGINCEEGENYRCDFEQGFCNMLQNDARNTFNWTLQQGRYVDGPSEDRTFKNQDGHFAYLHIPKGRDVPRAVLSGPWLYSEHCIKLWYYTSLSPRNNQYQYPTSRFNILTRRPVHPGISRHSVRSVSGGWKFVNFTETVGIIVTSFKVEFAMIRWDTTDDEYVAIDDIQFIKGNCSSPEATDACNPNPCQHGGLCEKREGFSYICFCPAGYSGWHCEKEADPCRSQPCYFGSTCYKHDRLNFTCSCPPNATGNLCEQEIGNICTSSPCMNGGTCRETQFGYRCECTEWYTGKTCTKDKWCVEGRGKELCPDGACAFDHENGIGYCKWREQVQEKKKLL